jgi:hypothetical protein
LGNPVVDEVRMNGLAQCQVPRLYGFLKKLSPGSPVVFWMDTLCIPALHPTQYMEQRRAAIANMREIYMKATCVLVLDSELLQVCSHVSNLELMIRVVTSGWMRRVWTLQEGVLNEAIYVQLKDRTINLNQVEGWLQHNIFSARGRREFMGNEAIMT